MCKKILLWAVSLGLLLTLCACGGAKPAEAAAAPAPTAAHDPNLGRYTCTSVKMDEMNIGAEGQWIELRAQGKAVVFLMDEPDAAEWRLSGARFTLTMAGETVGTGTLEAGVLTLDLMGTQCVFLRDGAQAPEETAAPAVPDDAEDQPPEGYACLSCYGDLYRITYPTDRFRPSSDGLTDLVGLEEEDPTQAWITRLDSRDAVDQWLSGLAAKADSEEVLSCEQHELTVAARPAQAVVYEDAKGWHSAVVVDFGRNRGNKTYPMYAACLSFSGASREAVWGEEVQTLAASLTLND